jgi:hypothetical protein
VGDFNLDGHLDILKTHFADDTAILIKITGGDIFAMRRSAPDLEWRRGS